MMLLGCQKQLCEPMEEEVAYLPTAHMECLFTPLLLDRDPSFEEPLNNLREK